MLPIGQSSSAGGNNASTYACAVDGNQTSSGSVEIGSLLYNPAIGCWVQEPGPSSKGYSSWYCLCQDSGSAVSPYQGDQGQSCSSVCAAANSSSINSCSTPVVQSVCYDPAQNTFGYQNASSNVQSCLTVSRPIGGSTTTSLQTASLSSFACLCSPTADVSGLAVSRGCEAVAAAATKAATSSSRSLSTGAIVGIAVGGAVGLTAVIAVLALFLRRKRRRGVEGSKQNPHWPDDERDLNAFVGTTQFNTKSTDLLAFGEVYGKENTSSVMTASSKGMTESTLASQDDSKADMKPFGSMDTTGTGLANIIVLQEEQEIQAVELPMPRQRTDGGVSQQVGLDKSILDKLGGSTDLDNSALSEVGLTSTWKIAPEDLNCRMKNGRPMLLGEGGYGKVYRGVLNKADVAVKVVTSHDPNQQAKFVQEIITLRACHNTHIVQFLGACIREQQTFMVMEFMSGGDLFSQIDHDTTGRFGWYKLGQRIALDVVKGLSYLHSKSIAHLDLKSPNVLLTSSYTAKIGDVGLGKIIAHQQAAATRQGSFLWAAPEQLLGTECSTASDIFSFGTVLWEICTGEKPLQRITRPLEVPKEGPEEVEDLIKRCHSEKPKDRPTADDIFDLLRAATRKNSKQFT